METIKVNNIAAITNALDVMMEKINQLLLFMVKMLVLKVVFSVLPKVQNSNMV